MPSVNKYCYAREKLYGAMLSLAIGQGDVRARLKNAYEGFHPLTEKHFPPEMQEDWKWVTKQLTRVGPAYDHKGQVSKGQVECTMGRIRNSTGAKIAETIFRLGWELHTNEKYL